MAIKRLYHRSISVFDNIDVSKRNKKIEEEKLKELVEKQ